MDYEITMPKLTDTMESGLIVRWLKNEGEYVEKGEPVVEVETEKAIQEVPVFKSGIIKKIVASEGDEVPVGKTIAILEITEEKPKTEKKEVQQSIKEKEEHPKKELENKEEKVEIEEEIKKTIKLPEGAASPSAKKLASKLNIDIKKLQEKEKLPIPAHEEDILTYYYSEYFDIDAIKEAKAYNINLGELVNRYKKNITKNKVLEYAKEKNLYKIVETSKIQKRLIEHLSKSAQIPVYHIYETFSTKYIPHDEKHTLTAWILKIFGDTMQNHYRTRIYYNKGSYKIYAASNVAVAVAIDEELFSPVIKNIESKTIDQIQKDIDKIKEKAKEKSFLPEDFESGTFGISNLGMFGIEMFDAVIPYNYSGIAAIGAENRKKIKIVITFDHRIINGREAALFVKHLKEKFEDKKYIDSLLK